MGVADLPPAVCILGCGRWSMGDDQAGLRAAELLAARGLPGCLVRVSESPGTDLPDGSFATFDMLILIDAAPASPTHPAGTVHVFEYPRDAERLPARRGTDSHSFGVAAGLRLAQALGVLPGRVRIYVLFGEAFERSLEMSREVELGIKKLAEQVAKDAVSFRRG